MPEWLWEVSQPMRRCLGDLRAAWISSLRSTRTPTPWPPASLPYGPRPASQSGIGTEGVRRPLRADQHDRQGGLQRQISGSSGSSIVPVPCVTTMRSVASGPSARRWIRSFSSSQSSDDTAELDSSRKLMVRRWAAFASREISQPFVDGTPPPEIHVPYVSRLCRRSSDIVPPVRTTATFGALFAAFSPAPRLHLVRATG